MISGFMLKLLDVFAQKTMKIMNGIPHHPILHLAVITLWSLCLTMKTSNNRFNVSNSGRHRLIGAPA
eukprot:1158532-Pelagomonas_calceolata.AAC.15